MLAAQEISRCADWRYPIIRRKEVQSKACTEGCRAPAPLLICRLMAAGGRAGGRGSRPVLKNQVGLLVRVLVEQVLCCTGHHRWKAGTHHRVKRTRLVARPNLQPPRHAPRLFRSRLSFRPSQQRTPPTLHCIRSSTMGNGNVSTRGGRALRRCRDETAPRACFCLVEGAREGWG